jgi:hypothetical protein
MTWPTEFGSELENRPRRQAGCRGRGANMSFTSLSEGLKALCASTWRREAETAQAAMNARPSRIDEN